MFRLGSRSKSPRGAGAAAMAMYGGNGGGGGGGNQGGGESNSLAASRAMAPQDPPPLRLQKEIAPYGSSLTMADRPATATGRGHQSPGAFHKSLLSPTASIFSTAASAAPTADINSRSSYSMARNTRSSQRSLLGRGRKQPSVAEEFDPTTFRKNRSRPALGARGQDAVYQEYDDLFEEDDDGDGEGAGGAGADAEDTYADGEASQTEASGDENGFFLLQIDGATGKVKDRTRDIAPISPKRRRPSNLNLSFLKKKHSFSSTESIAPAPPRPPQTPPRSWRPSSNIAATTTPPRSTAPSVEESVDPRLPITAPPTPPPKSAPISSDHANTSHRKTTGWVAHHSDLASPRPAHPAARATERRFGERTLAVGASATTPAVGRSRSVERLSTVNVPSPTLFSSATDYWTEHSESHAAAVGLAPPPPPPPKDSALTSAPAATSATSTPHVTLGHSSRAYGATMLPDEAAVAATEGSFSEHCEGAAVPGPGPGPGPRPGPAVHQPRLRASSRLRHLSAIGAVATGKRQSTAEDQEARSDTSVDEFLDNSPIEYHRGSQYHHCRHHTASNKPAHPLNAPPTTDHAGPAESERKKKEKSHGAAATAFESGSEAEVDHHDRRQQHASEHTPRKRRRSSSAVQAVDNSSSSEPGEAEEPMAAEGRPKADLAYLRAFRAFVKASASNDAFVSRNPRFDAVQAHRICSHLRDDCSPRSDTAAACARRSPPIATVRPAIDSRARLREAGEEIMTGLWALMAGRWLNFGKTVISPAHELLMAACTATAATATKPRTRRGTASQMSAKTAIHQASGSVDAATATSEQRRALDLGGIPVADWGWHCAVEYPKVEVYTVTQRTAPEPANLPRGPNNHRHVVVDCIYRLPFPDNHFDVISARTLFLILKSSRRGGQQTPDEYDRCMEECVRVLKPGGYFEFMVFDSEVVNAGPLASKLFGRLAAALETNGRDHEPTKRWIARLNSAGFTGIMRAWTLLPLAPPVSKPRVPRKDDDDGDNGSGDLDPLTGRRRRPHYSHGVDAVEEQVRRKIHAWESAGESAVAGEGGVTGSTTDVAAVTGLLSGWVWGKWLRTAGISDEEMVGGVIEEAKERGSGLRTLCGYAKKPL